MIIYDIIDILTGLVESIIAFMLFDNFLERRQNLKNYIYSIGIIGLTIGINISNHFLNFGYWNVLCIIVLMTIFSWLYNSDLKTRVFLSVLSVLLSGAAEVIILLLLAKLKNVTRMDIYMNNNLRVLGTVLSKALGLAVVKGICIIKGRKLTKIQAKHWVLFTVIYIVVLSTTYLLFNPQIEVELPYMPVLCSIGLLCSVFIVLYLYENMSKQTQQLKEKELLEQQYEFQVKHLNELVLAQAQLKSVKHDLKNHMISLKSYLEIDDKKSAMDYIENLSEKTNMQTGIIDTGNTVIDAIITAKKNLAAEKNIEFTDFIQIPEDMKIDSSDCCVIFGNALDNAIEACEKTNKKKYISLSLVYRDEMLICKIINSMCEKENASLITTKKNKHEHGIGIENIKNTLIKYKSEYRFEQENGKFVFSFIIFNV